MKNWLFIFLMTVGAPVFAVDYHQFPDPAQQKAYESIISELRCLVCQNQTIADSNAELAADLRRQVYEMLQQGKSKADVLQFMTERYGDFVLYNPPFKAKTGLLWLGPLVFLIIGLIMIGWFIRRKKQTKAIGIDTVQQEKIRRLLDNED